MKTRREDAALSEKDQEIIAVGASVAAGCLPCTKFHRRAAAGSGATEPEILGLLSAARRPLEESALRRSGRPVPDPAYTRFEPIDTAEVDAILARYDFDAGRMPAILESIQAVYGYLPVAALKRVSQVSGAPYALIYGTATYYSHLRFTTPRRTVAVCRCTDCLLAGSQRLAERIGATLGTGFGRAEGGEVALEQLPAHVPGAQSPLVTLDGKAQTGLTVEGAAAWAAGLAGGPAA